MYNKNEFNKVNDKKVLHKVKKQWVTISIAMLAMLGASGVAISGPSNASADTNNNNPTASKTVGNSSSSNTKSDEQSVSANLDTKVTTPTDNHNALTSATSNNDVKPAIRNSSNTSRNTSNSPSSSPVNSNDSNVATRVSNNQPTVSQASGTSVSKGNISNSVKQNNIKQSSAASKVASSAISDVSSNDSAKPNHASNSSVANSASNGVKSGATTNSSAARTTTSNSVANSSSANVKHVSSQLAPSNANVKQAKNNANSAFNPFVNLSTDQLDAIFSNKNNINPSTLFSSELSDPKTTDTVKQADQGAIAAWNSIHSDDTQSTDSNVQTNTVAYKAGYKGLADAWNKYNQLNSTKGTQATKNYSDKNYQPSDGNSTNPNDPHSVDHDLNTGSDTFNGSKKAQIINDPHAKSQNASELNNHVSASTNIASDDAVNNYNNQVTFDKNNNITINQNDQTYYNQGITDFLKYQGAYDAETGRWNGANNNEAYKPDVKSQNAYDQAYAGAQEAISQQFSNDSFNYDVNNPSSFNPQNSHQDNISYDYGFNDVKNKIVNNGVAYVSDASQVDKAVHNTNNEEIKSINFLNDMDISNNGLNRLSISEQNGNNFDLTFNGQNHVVDFGPTSYEFNKPSVSKNPQLNLENFHTLYGIKETGPIYFNDKQSNASTVNYQNITYIGSQLIHAYNSKINVNGNLNVFSVGNYKAPFNYDPPVQNGTNTDGSYTDNDDSYDDHDYNDQENMEVSQLNINPGSNYYGSTTGGDVIYAHSSDDSSIINIGSGAHMKLVPMRDFQGNGPENATQNGDPNSPAGIYLDHSNLNINKNASIEIDPTMSNAIDDSDPREGIALGLYDPNGQVQINGGELNINESGSILQSPQSKSATNYIGGNVNITNNGWFRIHAKNLYNSQYADIDDIATINPLLTVTGQLNVTDGGNMDIHTDGTGISNLVLLDNERGLNINDPGEKVQLRIDNRDGKPGAGKLFTNDINAYLVRYAVGYKNRSNNVPNPVSNNQYAVVTIPSKGNIKLKDLNGKIITSNQSVDNQANYLSFNAGPSAIFNGHIKDQNDLDKTNHLSGSIILKNLPSNLDKNNSNGSINMTVNDDNNSDNIVKAPDLLQWIDNNGNKHDINVNSTKQNNTYNFEVPQDAKNGNVINFDYKLPNTPQNIVSVKTDYFDRTQTQELTKNNSDPNDRLDPNAKIDASNNGIKDGISDASQNVTQGAQNTPDYIKNYKNSTDESLKNNYINNYNQAYAGYKQGATDLNHTNYNKQVYNPDNQNEQSDAYKHGYKQSNIDYDDGFNSKIKGTNSSSNNQVYNDGVDSATGAQNAINGNNNNSNDQQKVGHGEFNAGFNAQMNNKNGAEIHANYDDAYNYGADVAKNLQNPSTQQSTPAAKAATNINNGIQNALNGESGNGTSASNAAADATNKGLNNQSINSDNAPQTYANNIGKSYSNGERDAANGNHNTPGIDVPNNQADNDAYQKAQTDYSNGKKGNNVNPNSPGYNRGNQDSQATNTGINDAQNGNSHNYSNPEQNAAYNNAKQAFNDGEQGNNNTTDPVANAAGKAAKQGIADGASGADNSGKYNQDPEKSAYNNAKNSFNKGFSNQTQHKGDTNANIIANQAGQDTYNGMNDAIAGKANQHPDNVNYNNAYHAAIDGFNGQIPNKNDKQERKSFNRGNAVGTATQAASQDVDNNESHDAANSSYNQNKPSNSDDQKAYNEAYDAYKNGANKNNTDNASGENSDKQEVNTKQGLAYNAGTTHQATDDGISDAKQGNNDHAHLYPNGNNHDAYNNAKAAYNAGFNGQSDIPAVNKNQGTAYNYGRAAQAAVQDASSGKYRDDSYNDNTSIQNDKDNKGKYSSKNETESPDSSYTTNDRALPWTTPQKQEYDDAYQAYEKGIENRNKVAADAKATAQAIQDGIADGESNDINSHQSQYQGKTEQSEAYNNAKKSFESGYHDDIDNDNSNADKNVSTDNGGAYNYGRAVAAAVKDSENGVNKNDSNSAYNNDFRPGTTWNGGQEDAYNQAVQAYHDGLNNKNEAQNTPDTTENKAYQAGQDTAMGIHDAISGNQADSKHAKNSSNPDYQNAYNNAKDGINHPDAPQNNEPATDNAYQAGKAYNNGMNDAAKGNQAHQPNPDVNPSKDAYNQGQKDYNDGKSDNTGANVNPNSPGYHKGNQDKQDSDAAKQGINDAQAGQDKSNQAPYNTDPKAKAAYKNAQDAFNDGKQGYNNTDAAKADPTANEAGKAASQGAQDAQTGKDNSGNYNNNPEAQNAYKQAKYAYNDGTKGQDNSTDPDADNAGKAAKQGAQDAQSGQNNDTYQNDPEAQRAYDHAKNAYNAGLDGNNNADAQLDPNANIDGQAARQAIIDGSNSNSNLVDSGNNPNQYNSDQQTAYNHAKEAYEAGLKGQTNNASLDPHANEVGANTKHGIDDAISNNNNDTKNTGNSDYDNAYNYAKDGINNSSHSTKGEGDNNTAYKAGQAYINGVNAASNGNNTDNKPADNDQPDNDYYKKGNQDYNDGKNNKPATPGSNINSNSPGYHKGNQDNEDENNAAKQGAVDAQAGQDKSNQAPYNTDSKAKAAYTNAQKAYNAGKDGNNTDQDKSDAKLDPTANEAGKAANQGAADAQAGKDNSENYNGNPESQNAYKHAQDAYNAGKAGKPSNDSNAKLDPDAYNDAQAAKQGINDAQTNDNHSYKPGTDAAKAYNNAKQAFNDGEQGNNNTTDPIANAAGKAAKQGIADGASGADNSGKYSQDPEKSAYNNAKQAFNDGLAGHTNDDVSKLNPNANQAGQDTKQGIDDALAGKSKSTDPKYTNNSNYNNAYDAAKNGYNGEVPTSKNNNPDEPERKAYNAGSNVGNAAQAAYQDLNNNKKSNDPDSDYQQSMPKNSNEQQAYKEAYSAYKNGANSDNSDNPSNENKNDADTKQGLAYQNGQTYHATKDGIADAKSGQDNNGHNGQKYDERSNNNPDRNAYDNAKAAYQAGFNGQSDSDAINNNQGGSYNYGRAAQAAIQDASSGKYRDDSYDDNPAVQNDKDNNGRYSSKNEVDSHDSAYTTNDHKLPWTTPQKQEYNDAYQAYIKGQQDAQAAAKNKSAAESAAVDRATKAGMADAESNGIINNYGHYQNDEKQRNAYNNAKDAFNQGYKDNDSYINQATANNDGIVYNQGRAVRAAVKDAENGIKTTDPNSSYNNDFRPGTDGWTDDQKQAYHQAMQAYENGLNNKQYDSNDHNNDNVIQNKAYQAGQDTAKGVHDAISNDNHDTKDTGNSDYDNAYNNAKDGMNHPDAPQNNEPATDNAYQAGKAYNNGMNDAAKGNQAHQPNPDVNPSKDAYNQGQKDYNDGNNDNTGANVNPNSPGYHKGNQDKQDANAAKQGIIDASNGNEHKSYPEDNNNPDSDNTKDYNSDQQQAYDKAKSAYNDGMSGKTDTNAAKADPIANKAGINTKQGIDDAMSNHDNAKVTTGNTDYDNAYNNTKDGMNHPDKPQNGESANNNAYQAGKAYDNGMNDAANGNQNHKPGTSNNPYSPSNNDAYNRGKNDYNDGQKNTPATPGSNVNPNSPGYDKGNQDHKDETNAANQGIDDASNGNQDNARDPHNPDSAIKNYNQSQQNAYNRAKTSYNAGINGDTTSPNANLDKNANNVGTNTKQGIDDAISGNNAKSDNTDYQNAYNNAKDGINPGTPQHGEPTTNNAYQAGKAYDNGMNDAAKGNGNHAHQPNPDVNPSKDAYNQGQNDYNDGKNGKPNTPGSNVHPQSPGYNKGNQDKNDQDKKDANDAANKAIEDASNGNQAKAGKDNPDADTHNYDQNQQNAYNHAKTSYNDGINGDTSSSDAKLDPHANKVGTNTKQGIDDAISGNNAKSDNTDYQNAYNNAKDGINPGTPQHGEPTTNNAYQAGKAYAAGTNDASNDNNQYHKPGNAGSDIPDTSSNNNAYNQGQNDYNDGKNNTPATPGSNVNPNSPGYHKGNQDKKNDDAASQAGIDDASNGNQHSATDPSNPDKNYAGNSQSANAYDKAKAAYNDGMNGKTNSDAAKADPIANKAGINTKQGINDALSNHNNAKATTGNTDYDNAYNNAKDGMNHPDSPQNGESANNNAYQAGKSYINGTNDAANGNQDHKPGASNNPDTPSNNDAYNRGKNDYNDGKNGKPNMPGSNVNPQSPGYDKGNQDKINQENQDAANQGIKDASNGNQDQADDNNNPDSATKNYNQNQQKAYNDAKKSYDAGINGDTTSPDAKLNPHANDVGTNTKQGIDDAISGNGDKHSDNTDYQNAYNNAEDGINPGTPQHGEPTTNNAYQAGKNYVNGENDAANDNHDHQPANDPNDHTSNNAYNQGQKDYNDGKSGNTGANVNPNSPGYHKGQQDANNNNNNYPYIPSDNNGGNTSVPTNNNSTDANNGSNDFINGGSNNGGKSSAFNNGYNESQKGFDDRIANKPNKGNGNRSYNKGYKAGSDYKAGEKAASRHIKSRANKGTYAYRSGYNAYNAGLHNKRFNDRSQNKAFRKAYKQAYKAGHSQYVANKIAKKAASAGYKAGESLNSPSRLRGRSKAYKRAYMRAYRHAMKLNIPRYVYNLRRMYRHSKPTFTRRTRNAKYRKTALRNRHVFIVKGYGFTPTGRLTFRVRGGWINASKRSVADLYYRSRDKKHTQNVRVIKNHGTYIYKGTHFDRKHAIKYMRTGKKVRVKKLERVDHISRFYIGHGKYISSNKEIVQRVN